MKWEDIKDHSWDQLQGSTCMPTQVQKHAHTHERQKREEEEEEGENRDQLQKRTRLCSYCAGGQHCTWMVCLSILHVISLHTDSVIKLGFGARRLKSSRQPTALTGALLATAICGLLEILLIVVCDDA